MRTAIETRVIIMHDHKNLILVLDVGSSGLNAIYYGAGATPTEGMEVSLPQCWTWDEAGQEVLGPKALVEQMCALIDEALALLDDDQRVVAVGMATLVGSLVGLDEAGRPLTPIYSYADTRSAESADQLREELGEKLKNVEEQTGCKIHPAYWPAQLYYLYKHKPALVAKVATWCDLSTYLYSALLGSPQPIGISVASWGGMLDRYNLSWHQGLLERLQLQADRFPPLADSADWVQGISSAFAERWPQLREARWYRPLGDGAVTNLGCSGFEDDAVVLTIGTTSAARVTVRGTPKRPQGLWSYRIDREYSLVGGALSEGGGSFAWLQERLQLPPLTELEEQLMALLPAAHGVTVLPFLRGERAPGWSGDATGMMLGLTDSTSNVEIVRAWLEAIAYRLTMVVEALPERSKLIASGGGLLASRPWQRIIADVLGKSLYPVLDPEVTSRGVAFLIAHYLGNQPKPSPLMKPVEPISEHYAAYRRAMAAQRELYQRVMLT